MALPHSLAPRLPYDIVISVIEILLAESSDAPECIDVLRTFSLVSQSFVAFCQKRLFRRFNMGKADAKKCFSILQQSPHLIPYVEEVWMYLYSVVNVSVAEMELLRILTSLCHLSVMGYRSWEQLSLSVRRTITSLLLPQRITSFAMSNVEGLPDGLLATWRNLKSLSVRNESTNSRSCLSTNLDSDDEEVPYTNFGDVSAFFAPRATPEDSFAIRLETLSLIDSDNVLLYMLVGPDMIDDKSPFTAPSNGLPEPERAEGLAIFETYRSFRADYRIRRPSHFEFSHLSRFTIDLIEPNLLPVFSVIHHARNTLKTLDIRQRYLHRVQKDPFGFDPSLLAKSSDPLPDEVSLKSLIHLEHLSITLFVLAPYIPLHLNALSAWCALLRRAPRGIRTLEIILDAFYIKSVLDLLPWFPELDDDDDAATANTPFSALDEIVSNADAFPCLEYLCVKVRLPDDQDRLNSEAGLTVDVVQDRDPSILRAWVEKIRKAHADAKSSADTTPSPAGSSVAFDAGADDDDLSMYGADSAASDPGASVTDDAAADDDDLSMDGTDSAASEPAGASVADDTVVDDDDQAMDGTDSAAPETSAGVADDEAVTDDEAVADDEAVVDDDDLAMHGTDGASPEPEPSGRNSSDLSLWPSYENSEVSNFDWASSVDPLPYERVEKSVFKMMRLTAKRLGSDDSAFVVAAVDGAHSEKVRGWGYGERRRDEFFRHR